MHIDWCGEQCAECVGCTLDDKLSCSPDCSNLSEYGKPIMPGYCVSCEFGGYDDFAGTISRSRIAREIREQKVWSKKRTEAFLASIEEEIQEKIKSAALELVKQALDPVKKQFANTYSTAEFILAMDTDITEEEALELLEKHENEFAKVMEAAGKKAIKKLLQSAAKIGKEVA